MNPERWQQIDKLVEQALEQESSQRADFLDEACAGDEELRREVESLLAANEQVGSFIEAPALEAAAIEMAGQQTQSWVGERIGNYKILSLLGKGGMGEVFLAQDSRLGRRTALKLLPVQFTQDKDRVRRFEREARAASALNHPNILTIYEIGQAAGTTFMATEFIDGETLRQRMIKRRLELPETLDIGIQVTSALVAAHESHIVHRDIKPENIMVRPDGYAKVLDFGLAKLIEPRAMPEGSHVSGTGTLLTEAGMAMGTAHYMSPEQALGQEVDHRADLFSLGAVLYEMATGKPAFQGSTSAAIFDAILHQEPIPLGELNQNGRSNLPGGDRHRSVGGDFQEELQRIITKALEKDREVRYQTASDLRADLKRLQREMESKREPAAVGSSAVSAADVSLQAVSRRRSLILVGLLTVLLIGIGLGWYFWPHSGGPRPELKQRQLTTNSSETPVTAAAISPDGKYLAFADENGTYLRLIDSGERHSLTIPTGFEVTHLSWFPDGTKLLASGLAGKQKIFAVWKISILGEPPVIVRDDVKLASVSPDGSQIAFVSSSGREIWLMGANGEQPRRVLASNGIEIFRCLTWFPNGQRLGYVRDHYTEFLVDVESCDLKGSLITKILPNLWVDDLSVLPDGKMVYSTRRDAWRSSGDTETDLEPLKQSEGSLWEIRTDMRNGRLVSRPRRISSWPGIAVPRLSASRDGKRLIFVKESGNTEVYVGELEENGKRMKTPKRLTFDDHRDFPSAWTPDSKAVLFNSDRNGNEDIFRQALDERTAETIVSGPTNEYDPRVTPDGASLLYHSGRRGDRLTSAKPGSLWRAPIAGGPTQLVVIEDGFSLRGCPHSPSKLCLVDERNEKQLVFYDFDFSKGKAPELARIELPPKLGGWGLSPDGSRVAVMFLGEQNDRIRILHLNGGPPDEVKVSGWGEIDFFCWAADGKGVFASTYPPGSKALLYVDLEGHAEVLWQQPMRGFVGVWPIPSPNGRYLAFAAEITSSNAWMIEDF